jgi:hypothetical protein
VSALHCPDCGAHDVTENHIGRCHRNTVARTEAEALASEQGIPAVTAADLWAHLGHVASAEDATRIVRQVVDLGWRPVVGKDPKRLWSRDRDPRTDLQRDLFGGVA